MKCLKYTLIIYLSLTMASAIVACQPSCLHDVSDDDYDHVYEQLDRKENRDAKRKSYFDRLSRAEAMWNISTKVDPGALAPRKQRQEVAKLRKCINQFLERKMEEIGLDPQSVDLQIKISYKQRNKEGR